MTLQPEQITFAFCRGAMRQHRTAEQFLQTSMKSFSCCLSARERLVPSTTSPCWITWSSSILTREGGNVTACNPFLTPTPFCWRPNPQKNPKDKDSLPLPKATGLVASGEESCSKDGRCKATGLFMYRESSALRAVNVIHPDTAQHFTFWLAASAALHMYCLICVAQVPGCSWFYGSVRKINWHWQRFRACRQWAPTL